MQEENEAKADISRWVIWALVFLISWLTLRKIFRKSFQRLWNFIDSRLLDHFQEKYNDRMRRRKEALFFDGLSQMMKDAGRPLHVLEIGAGAGANFAFYPDGTTVTCLDPGTHFTDLLIKNAARFPQIQLGELHDGFAEDMSMIESGSVDAVISTLLFCSVDNIDKCLQEIIRVLRPVGILVYFSTIKPPYL